MTSVLKTSDITVNGVVVPWSVVSAEAQNHGAASGKWTDSWRSAARAIVIRELLLQRAKAMKLAPDPQEVAEGKLETDDEALIRQVLDISVAPHPVDPARLRAVYDGNPEKFRSPPLWEVSHILFAADPADAPAREAMRLAAEQVISELSSSPRKFAALAEQHSACQSRSAGGKLGQIGPGDTVAEFEFALRQLKEGEISPHPVTTRFGFHVIRLDAAAQGSILPFETVLPRLREAADKAAWVEASRRFTAELIAAAEIQGVDLAA